MNNTDLAAEYFGVLPEDVTSEQRRAIKTAMFVFMYGHHCPLDLPHMEVFVKSALSPYFNSTEEP